jgi:hypothetical protein
MGNTATKLWDQADFRIDASAMFEIDLALKNLTGELDGNTVG